MPDSLPTHTEAVPTKACPECEGTGKVYEPCGCYECEYSDAHGGLIPCLECEGSGSVREPR